MFNKGYKILCKLWLIFVIVVIFSGCGILHPASKSPDGYYTSHYISCGPQAIQNAIEHYYKVNEEYRILRHLSRKDISQDIQDTDSFVDGRKFLTHLYKDFAAITWPHEIIEVCRLYGFEAVRLDDISKLKQTDTGIVLLHKKWSMVYHWICVPVESAHGFYGSDNTVILDVYLLRRITR